MKKIKLILCCLLLSISLAGCGHNKKESDYITIGDRTFLVISSDEKFNYWNIYVDMETKVQYILFDGDESYSAVMSVLIDADGKPILYEGSLE